MNLNKAAQALGRKGGRARSERKTEASRANFAKARAVKAAKRQEADALQPEMTGPAFSG